MPLLILVRHGETDWNRERRWQGHRDLPLTGLGEAQAAAVAERLAHERPDALWSSDLQRAWETAVIIGRACGLEPRSHPSLREVDVGSWEGLTAAEAAERDPESHARWLAGLTPWTDGETYAAMGERVLAALERLCATHPSADTRLVIVTHGGPIRAVAGHIVGLPPEGRRLLGAGPNASITMVDAAPDDWRLLSYNDAGHLNALAPPAAEVAQAQPATE